MGYNSEFEDLMDNINNIAKGYGFKNGIDWANLAQKKGEISWSTYKKYENAHNLRIRFSHGNAKDINISYDTYKVVQGYEKDIKCSHLRKNSKKPINSSNNKSTRKQNNTNNIRIKKNTIKNNENYSVDDYLSYYNKMYGGNTVSRRPSLSYTGREIQEELRTMRKYPNAEYDDLVEAAFKLVKTYSPGDFAAIRTEYGCYERVGVFNKTKAQMELAEKMVASLKDYELDILMGK